MTERENKNYKFVFKSKLGLFKKEFVIPCQWKILKGRVKVIGILEGVCQNLRKKRGFSGWSMQNYENSLKIPG